MPTEVLATDLPSAASRRCPTAIAIAIPFAHAITLLLMGRIWWCACGTFNPISLDAWGPHNSQHLIDPYAFSHLLHGVIFFFAFNWGAMRRRPAWGLVAAMLLESAWEVFENTPFTINRYRATAATFYNGDTILNSLSDLAICVLGWFIARRIGVAWSVVLFLVLEIGCLLWIRDNLTLNVINILHPFEAIKSWQSGH
ncbi:MAG: DUF2585 family protein [Burkholderiales bacterium]|nr:DUF2585 family protein [Phycisphaerae bacterium]